tara:strand:- start:1227 stop:1433 length:207 start_codon:yes stop_codon:yes gene_type:complete
MKFRCEIEMDNAAFADDPLMELSRLLSKLLFNFEREEGVYPLSSQLREGIFKDTNGNKVGKYTIEGED